MRNRNQFIFYYSILNFVILKKITIMYSNRLFLITRDITSKFPQGKNKYSL